MPDNSKPFDTNTGIPATRPATMISSASGITSLRGTAPMATRKVDQVDTYFGVTVSDPYRWLEDDNSPETAEWVEQQNSVTFSYLEQIPFRAKLKERLESLFNYPKYSQPFRRGDRYFFYKNDGLQNQYVLYMQEGLDGEPKVLLDPNTFSDDGTASLGRFAMSKDGRYAAYGIRRSGSDWEEIFVMDLDTRETLPESLNWVKVSGTAWKGDGFFYSRYDAPESGYEYSSKNEFHKVYYHRIGDPQSEDQLVYEDAAHAQQFHLVETTEDERYAILYISDRGSGRKGNAIYYCDLTTSEWSFQPIVAEIGDDWYGVLNNIGDQFVVQTDKDAPNRRVILIDRDNPDEQHWKEILPERAEPLEGATTAGGKLIALYMKDVATHVYLYGLDGTFENEIKLPGPGSAGGFGGNADDTSIFYTFSSLTYPPAIFRYDIVTGESTLFRAPEIPHYNPKEYETRQIFFTSNDGTRVPMFVVHKAGLKLDGTNPTLLYGYGGFNVSLQPYFSSLQIALLEQGVVYVIVNLRGGGEYGERWHEEGIKLKKQNVFDDFIAAAEYLIANGYTSPEKLAMQGGSNGGLLVGAVMNQRPELFRVAIPQVGVMDMLRFHRFTIGWNWISDYGSSDNEEEFRALYAYSPLHNIREGVDYPATLVMTADHDDRVVPAHSFKYAATLQEKYRGDNPMLIRIETKSGHGSSNTTKMIEQTADAYAFVLYNLGVVPRF
jgi:prolyl oligopeptidase